MKTSNLSFWTLGLTGLIMLASCQKGTDNGGPEPAPGPAPAPVEKTEPIAGTGTAGAADGPLATAQFSQPKGIAIDAAGNMYIADWGNERIRRISAAGQVSTLAGSTPGYANGVGAAAQFNEPGDVAVDAQGNVFVADINNDCIRRITASGTVTTYAGTNSAGYTDAVGAAARFKTPRGVAVDAQGNVYVADMGNHCIRKISPEGAVITLAGNGTAGNQDGTGTAARFNQPRDLALDEAGNVYVVDSRNNAIRKVTPGGVVTTLAGGGNAGYADGAGGAARFSGPKGICAAKNGTVYVADTDNNRIRRISTTGVVTTLAGDGTAGYAEGATTNARFNAPCGIALNTANTELFIVDQDNNRVRKIVLKP